MNWKLRNGALILATVFAFSLIGCEHTVEPNATSASTIPTTVPLQRDYAYTWGEFENMTEEERIEFQNSFPDQASFDAWLQSVQSIQSEMPWNNGGKRPEEYTWEEFEALTAEQQIAFQNSFPNLEGFVTWMDGVQYIEPVFPWSNGGKTPKDYTWEEFEALSADLQIAFQESFESFEDFDNWMQRVNPEENISSWVDEGKKLEEYTWEEFENMTPEEQIAFQDAFGSFEAFDEWLVNAQLVYEEDSWDNRVEDPSGYTWEEFEALSGEEQIHFQNSFENQEEFEEWLLKNMSEGQ